MKKIPIINQIIKDKKKELKINQIEFSEILQKSLSTIKKYDSGFPIPLDTLKIICDKLGLSIMDLIFKQSQENEKNNTSFYCEMLEKFSALSIDDYDKFFQSDSETFKKEILRHDLFKIILEFYPFKEKIKDGFDVIYFNDKYFIKDFNGDVLDAFTVTQATELINHFRDYMNYFIFKCQKENLNK